MTDMLISSTGLSARIHRLPGREPFMLAADLAEAYGTETRNIVRIVNRNPEWFGDGFSFQLTESEAEHLKSSGGISSGGWGGARHLPWAFTRAGATTLCGMVRSPMAAQVSKVVHVTFAEMEERAFEQMRGTLSKLRHELLTKKPIYNRIMLAASEGRDIDWLWRMASYPRHKLEQAVRECVGLGLIAAPLAGMQRDLFAGG